MSDFGFVGASYEAASITQDDEACINWYVEAAAPLADIASTAENESKRGYLALYPTPGLLMRAELKAGEVRGMYVIPGGATALIVSNDTLYSVDSAYTATSVGTLLTATGPVTITDNGAAAYLTDGTYRYSYTWGTATFTQQTDGPFSGGGVCDEVDNFIIYSNPMTNQWGCTDVGDVVSNPLNLGTILGASGNLIRPIADHRQVLLLGEKYSERWINVGTFPFPFAIVPGSSMQHGCAAPYSVARLGEGIAFLALDTRGAATVVAWGATIPQPQRISTFAIENAIQGYAVTSDAIGYTYSQSGHEFYVLTFPTADVTWVYDLATQLWHRRAWRDPGTGIYHRHRSNCCAVFGDDIIVGDFENGKVSALSQSTYTDDGDPLPCVRRCRHLTNDLKRQYFHDLQIQFQPGVGLPGSSVATGANYLSLPGGAGNYAVTPDSSALDLTGDMEIIAYIAPDDWTPAATEDICAKWTSVGNRAYKLSLNTSGDLVLTAQNTLSVVVTSSSTQAVGAADGTPLWVRAVKTGANVLFYTSTDAALTHPGSVTWTQLGTAASGSSVATLTGTAPFEIGSSVNGTAEVFTGKIYSVYLYDNSAGSSLVASFVANEANSGDATVTSSATGEVYTLHGTSAIAGNYAPAVQGADPEAILRWSNDGGFTFGTDRILKIGKAGKYRNRAIKRRLGSARDRVYEVVVTDPVYRVVVSANLNASSGAN